MAANGKSARSDHDEPSPAPATADDLNDLFQAPSHEPVKWFQAPLAVTAEDQEMAATADDLNYLFDS